MSLDPYNYNQQLTESSDKSIRHSRILSILSYILHPLLMPIYAYLALSCSPLFSWLIPAPARYYVALALFSTTIIVPTLAFMLMKRASIIKSYQMSTNQERVIPLILMTLIYLVAYLYIRSHPVFFVASITLLFAFVSSIISLVANFFIKVSLHCAGIATLVGMVISISIYYGLDMFYLTITTLLVAGIIGYIRLALKAHSATEVYVGYSIGILSALLTNYLLKIF